MYDDMEDDKEIAISKGESSLERLALKACPFCGGKADYLRIMSDLYWSVQCGKCGGGSGGSVNKTITRDKWNERAALALPSQRPDTDSWQDIATAPKDGTKVDLWAASSEERYCDARWQEKYKRWEYWALGEFDTMGWCKVDYPPTHWMPVPKPPERERL